MNNGSIVNRKILEIPENLNGEEFSYTENLRIEEITYFSDNLKVKGFLVSPEKKGNYPCIIYNRGGNREFGALTPERVVRFLALVASWGYVVAASQYRGNLGGEGQEQFGGDDINDVLNLIPLLEKHPDADTDRIGMMGGSRGGMMTYKALTLTNRIKAASIRCGVTDLISWTEDRKDMDEVYSDLIPGFNPDDRTTLMSRSPIYWAEKMCPATPILIMHGTSDWRVNPLSSIKMAERLMELKHPFRLVMLEGSDHSLTEHIDERNRLIKGWMDRFVRDTAPLPNLELHGE
ncbi:MAG: prolyl oligopeptidase family serine peptidase [Spirochaetaceae bacterium]|nr:prolyl oligopeptidase family serine peptidase [Spirochaetaceae bacterium]